MRRTLLAAALLLLASPAPEVRAADKPWRRLATSDPAKPGQRFTVIAYQADLDAGTVPASVGPSLLKAAEAARDAFAAEGFRAAADGRGVLIIVKPLEGNSPAGFFASPQTIFVNAKALSDPPDPSDEMTITHELFHGVQHSYREKFERWIGEGSANWAETLLFPLVNSCLFAETDYLKSPHLSLRHEHASVLDSSDGRPYGSSIFLRFLALHHPTGRGVVRAIWERLADPSTRSTLGAIEAVLDGRAPGGPPAPPLGPQVRDYFTRMVVGGVLGDEAPADCRLETAKWFTTHGSPPLVLSEEFARYAERWLKDRETSPLSESWTLAGLGMRYFEVAVPPGLPKGCSISASAEAGEQDLGLQAMTHRGGKWEVARSRWDAKTGRHGVSVGRLHEVGRPVILAMTRYATTTSLDPFTLRLRLVAADRYACDADETIARTRKKWPPLPTDPKERAEAEAMEQLTERLLRSIVAHASFTLEDDGTVTGFLGQKGIATWTEKDGVVTLTGNDPDTKAPVSYSMLREGEDSLFFDDGEQLLVFRRQ